MRAAWVILAVVTLIVFVASIPAYYRQALATYPATGRATLARIGLSPQFEIIYHIVLDTIIALVFFTTAVVIFWRRSNDRMAMLFSSALLTLGVAISTTTDALGDQGLLTAGSFVVQYAGIGLILLVFYLFPDGKYVPRWTRILVLGWIGWALAWFLFPTTSIDPENMPTWLRMVFFLTSADASMIITAQEYLRMSSFLLVLLGWFSTGVFAQIYRFTHHSTPEQRQQTKWVVFGLTAAVVGYFGFRLAPAIIPALREPSLTALLTNLIGGPIYTALLLLLPLSVLLSMMRFRLWDIDPLIQRTLLYGTLTGALLALYVGSVFIVQRLFRIFTGRQSDAAIIVTTLAIASLVQPLKRRLQDFIDRQFYRERVDFRRAFTLFSREIRTIIDLPELLEVLTHRTTELLHITHGAVFLYHDRSFELAHALNLDGANPRLSPPTSVLGRLHDGHTISQPKKDLFPLLVPLIAPRQEGKEMVGVLALGPRLSGQRYSREDQALLMGLADQAGTAIYVARLIEEKQAEAVRREEVERRLEAYRNSPIGRAETFAHDLLALPHKALDEIHRLTQEAGADPEAASLLANLPTALDSLGAEHISNLAEGFNYIYVSQFEPEMLAVGLRTLVSQLENYPTQAVPIMCRWDPDQGRPEDTPPQHAGEPLEHAQEALAIYRLCQAALGANTIPQITQLLATMKETVQPKESKGKDGLFHGIEHMVPELFSVAEALYAYERVDTTRDKLAYLASAIERLRRLGYLARTELSAADRPILHHIAESWLAVVAGTMSELQTRADIVCRLLTRHTWQDDVVPLVLDLHNDGRGAALNLRVTLAPAPEYTLLAETARVDRLAPGEEARVELRVRPHLGEGQDRFRARFIITYTDPRGPNQVENFADVVRLLAGEGEFQFIPNPYVVGTPLEADSPLFFGREDVVSFVQDNLSAHHRNNLVLIGQRRTGKTSLLKQLPVRLGDSYLPVYLDGQALGLDPGLPNFFLALATEIGFAMEDRDLPIDLPEYEDFVESPTVAFEHQFLSRVRESLGHRHLLIMFDEFEELETAVKAGNLDGSIFGFLRHLIQHSRNLSVIFCGTHRLEELAADYWSVLFNISLYRHIAFLEKDEAIRLIQEPVLEYGMRYDDLALDKIWQVTAGHPYFLQLLCHSLVNRHNKTERSYTTVADVNAALDDILASGEAHFVYLWAEATAEQRLILAALSRMIPLTGQATLVQVADYLAERGVPLERQTISDALHYLTLRDILTSDDEAGPTAGEVYRWKLGLLGLWAEKYKSLSRVIEEVQSRINQRTRRA